MTVRTARDVRESADDPGIAAVAILRVAANVADAETVTIGDDVYEFDRADDGVVAGNIAVTAHSDDTPANATDALIAAINAEGTENVLAIDIGANEILLVTADAPGGNPAAGVGTGIALAETMSGGSNAWDTAALRGGRAAGLQSSSQDARVPNATEVALGNMHFIFPFTLEGAIAIVRITATGIEKPWDGAMSVSGKRLTLDNSGSGGFDWAATDTVYVFAWGA
jgi:hypothetical protein